MCRPCNTERARKYQSTEAGATNRRNAVYRNARRNPIKHNARHLVKYHRDVGNIERPTTCEKCGLIAKVYAHHPDYSQPLLIHWLCMDCHCSVHKIAV